MVATDAYGQGIDKANIRLVIHWEPPVNFEVHLDSFVSRGKGKRPVPRDQSCTNGCGKRLVVVQFGPS